MNICPKCLRPFNEGNSPNLSECHAGDDDEDRQCELSAKIRDLQEIYMQRTCELTDQFTKQRRETMRLEDINELLRASLVECLGYVDRMGQEGVRGRARKILDLTEKKED